MPASRLLFTTLTTIGLSTAAVVAVMTQGPGRGGQADLPDGPGKAQVQSICAGCHSLTNITNARGYSASGWDELTKGMIALPPDVKQPILSYLGTHFPRKPGGDPVVVPGPVNVSIREWIVPTLGSRPHDPLAASDGSLWWTGQWANVLGRLDPATGAM